MKAAATYLVQVWTAEADFRASARAVQVERAVSFDDPQALLAYLCGAADKALAPATASALPPSTVRAPAPAAASAPGPSTARALPPASDRAAPSPRPREGPQ